MRNRADFTLPGLAGLLVVSGVLFAVWAARDSSSGSDAMAQPHHRPPPRGLYSARSHREPVTRTSIPRQQQRNPQTQSARGATTE